MLNSIPIALLLGAILGFFAGLGIGGGTLLILWLTLVLQTPQPEARAINLLFFIAAAGAVSLVRLKSGKLKINTIIPAIIAGCIAAAIFSFIGRSIDKEILRKIFGILLLATGVRELLYRPRKAK